MTDKLVIAVPSKGRLMEDTAAVLAAAGMVLKKSGHDRGYRGVLEGVRDVEVAFLPASEIARSLRSGQVHLGVTGVDLVHEEIEDFETAVEIIKPLGFGQANVIVAVPNCWIDVGQIPDLEEVGRIFRRVHGRHMRVATKYMSLTRRHFALAGVTSYRLVESLGATEGTPAAGTAELIVDITTTGATLAANRLKIIGEILRSEATLFVSHAAPWAPATRRALKDVRTRLGVA